MPSKKKSKSKSSYVSHPKKKKHNQGLVVKGGRKSKDVTKKATTKATKNTTSGKSSNNKTNISKISKNKLYADKRYQNDITINKYTEDRNTLAKEYRKQLDKIQRRFKNIQKKYGIKTPAIKQFEDKIKTGELSTSVIGKSEEELKKMLENLKIIDEMPTSFVSGSKTFADTFGKSIMYMSDEYENMFWKLYEYMVSEYGYDNVRKYNYIDTVEYVLTTRDTLDYEKLKEEVDKMYMTFMEADTFDENNVLHLRGK